MFGNAALKTHVYREKKSQVSELLFNVLLECVTFLCLPLVQVFANPVVSPVHTNHCTERHASGFSLL